jgi:hypothetical protein
VTGTCLNQTTTCPSLFLITGSINKIFPFPTLTVSDGHELHYRARHLQHVSKLHYFRVRSQSSVNGDGHVPESDNNMPPTIPYNQFNKQYIPASNSDGK